MSDTPKTDAHQSPMFSGKEQEKNSNSNNLTVRIGIDPMQDPFRPGYFMNYAENETEAEMVLRKLACWLGVGGYNATKVDADAFHHKIVDGINSIIDVEVKRKTADLERENAELRRQLAESAQRITDLKERLEILWCTDGNGNRVPAPEGFPDGIECMNATIALQDEHIANLKKQLAEASKVTGHCRLGDQCVCGGDLPQIREGCHEWRKP